MFVEKGPWVLKALSPTSQILEKCSRFLSVYLPSFQSFAPMTAVKLISPTSSVIFQLLHLKGGFRSLYHLTPLPHDTLLPP